jgi:hypothetical protein
LWTFGLAVKGKYFPIALADITFWRFVDGIFTANSIRRLRTTIAKKLSRERLVFEVTQNAQAGDLF